jgi:hypothetical protein
MGEEQDMAEENPVTGHPYDGRNDRPDDEEPEPGERPVTGEEEHQTAPGQADRDDPTASRAARGGTMPGPSGEEDEPSPGVPGAVAPSAAGGTPDAGSPAEVGEVGAGSDPDIAEGDRRP